MTTSKPPRAFSTVFDEVAHQSLMTKPEKANSDLSKPFRTFEFSQASVLLILQREICVS